MIDETVDVTLHILLRGKCLACDWYDVYIVIVADCLLLNKIQGKCLICNWCVCRYVCLHSEFCVAECLLSNIKIQGKFLLSN